MTRFRLAPLLAASAIASLAACAPGGSSPEYASGYSDGCTSSSSYAGAVPTLWGFDARALDTSAEYRDGVRAAMDDCGFKTPDETLATWVPLPFADHIALSDE